MTAYVGAKEILLGLAVTALFINTAFHWHHSGTTPQTITCITLKRD